ncbi:MAG: hypothetical protein HY744_05080 [Deltaproteobacteria bacterium]|nr:hypothetical protein [Deltaproteobacteria bacterium]
MIHLTGWLGPIIVVVVLASILVPVLLRHLRARSAGLVMAPQAFFFEHDDAKKIARCQECAGRMAPVIGGSIKVRDEGYEVHVTGYFQGRPVRLKIWVTFGCLSLEMKTSRKIELPAHFYLHYDQQAPAHAAEMQVRDAWDEHDRADQKYFVSPQSAPHLVFEDDPEDLRKLKVLYERLPPDLTMAVVGLLERDADPGGHLMAAGDTVTLRLSSKVTLSEQAGMLVGQYLDLLHRLTTAMETVWGAVAEQGSWQQQEQPVAAPPPAAFQAPAPAPAFPAPAAAGPLAPGTAVTVQWPDGSRYPAQVVQCAGGNYLCAFAGGQQQWVAASQVTGA